MPTKPARTAQPRKLPELSEQHPMMRELQRRAEAQVRKQRKNQRSKAGDLKAADPQRLLHELQVHQVELEMQNAELHEARDRMEGLLEKYTDLYDFAPVGYLSLDARGQILEANLSGAALLGVGRARLINQRLLSFVLPASRPNVLTFLKLVFAETGKQVCEATLLRENGNPFIASLHGSSAISVSGPRTRCRVVISDISALKQAEEAQQRLAAIVESSHDAIIGQDLNGIISSWNQGAEKIFGYSAGEMVGTPIVRLIPPDRQAEEQMFRGKVRRGESVRHFETLRQTKRGPLINVSITVSPIRDASGQIIGESKMARDITVRKRAEAILHQNEALVSALVAQAPVGVYVVDARFCLQQVNPRARPVFKNVRPLIGRNFSEAIHVIWPQRVADQVVQRFQHTLKTGEPYVSPEFAEQRRDIGVKEFYEWQIQRVLLPDGEFGVVCFFNDVTERKHAEVAQRRIDMLAASNQKLEAEIVRRQAVEQALKKSDKYQRQLLEQSHRMQDRLRHLSRQILHGQEEERKRISRELHDQVAQTLVGMNIHLESLAREPTINPESLRQKITSTQELVEKSVDLVHRFARDLRPTLLDDLGLIPALHSYLKEFSERTGVRVQFKAFAGVERLSSHRRTVIYRVAQSALTNTAQHAHATEVTVNIKQVQATALLEIHDNGKSFDVEKVLFAKRYKRLGLLGTRERVEMVDGSFQVESAPGKGTTIRAQIPFSHALKAARGLPHKSHGEIAASLKAPGFAGAGRREEAATPRAGS